MVGLVSVHVCCCKLSKVGFQPHKRQLIIYVPFYDRASPFEIKSAFTTQITLAVKTQATEIKRAAEAFIQ